MLSSSIHAVAKGISSFFLSHDYTPGRQTTQLKNGQRTWTDTSPRKTYQGPRNCLFAASPTLGKIQNVPGCFFLSFFFIVVQLQLSAFSLHSSTPPQLNPSPSPASTLPLGFIHVSFIVVPENPFPHYPFPTPLCYCYIVLNFNVSGYILFAFFFSVDYVPVKGEIIWYLSLTAWLISLSIMLSSSIHVVAKGRSSSVLSAV